MSVTAKDLCSLLVDSANSVPPLPKGFVYALVLLVMSVFEHKLSV